MVRFRLGPRVDTAVAVAALAVALAGVNVLATRHNARWDVTAGDRLTPSAETVRVLRAVPRPTAIDVFLFPGSPEGRDAGYLLEQFDDVNPRVRHRIIDPDARPGLAREQATYGYGTTIVRMDGREITLRGPSEPALASALLTLSRGERKRVCFTHGHGEPSVTQGSPEAATGAAELLRRNGYEVATVELLDVDVLRRCDVLAAAGPRVPLLPEERQGLQAFLDGEGKLLVTLDGRHDPALEEMLARAGVVFRPGIVVDPASSLPGDPNSVLVRRYESTNPVVTGLAQTLMIRPRPVEGRDDPGEGVVASGLGTTGEGAALITEEASEDGTFVLGQALDESEVGGREPRLGGASELPRVRRTRIVALGDTDWLTNLFLPAADNAKLLLNAVNWLAGDEELIGFELGGGDDRSVELTASDRRFVYLVALVGVPAVPAAWAGAALLRRRRR